MVGGTVGYNWQAWQPWVFGLEGDIDWTNIKGNFTNAACPTGCQTKNTWLGTARGRVGYAWDRVMPYVTGGLAVGDVKATQVGFGSVSDTKVGWTVGAGIEAALIAATGPRSSNISTSISATSTAARCLLAAERVGFQADEVRGRRELPVLIATRTAKHKAPDASSGAFCIAQLRPIFV